MGLGTTATNHRAMFEPLGESQIRKALDERSKTLYIIVY